jgi:hypothetical protein
MPQASPQRVSLSRSLYRQSRISTARGRANRPVSFVDANYELRTLSELLHSAPATDRYAASLELRIHQDEGRGAGLCSGGLDGLSSQQFLA